MARGWRPASPAALMCCWLAHPCLLHTLLWWPVLHKEHVSLQVGRCAKECREWQGKMLAHAWETNIQHAGSTVLTVCGQYLIVYAQNLTLYAQNLNRTLMHSM